MPDYFRPRTLDEALAIRAGRDVAVLAGGTDVYPAWTTRKGWGDPTHKDVLDISAVPGLRYISREPDHWRFGAATTWTDLAEAALPAAFDGYRAAAREVGGMQVQNRGTLAGNLCTASPAGDGIPCLIALDAEIELASVRGPRRLPVADFNIGYRQTALAPDEIVTAIIVPQGPPRTYGAFAKLGARRYLVISIAMASVVLQVDGAGLIIRAAAAVGACGPVATRLAKLERELVGQPLLLAPMTVNPSHVADLAPIDDIRGSAEYRRGAALQLLRDLLHGLASQNRKAA